MPQEQIHPALVDFFQRLIDTGVIAASTNPTHPAQTTAPLCIDEREAAKLVGMSLGWVRKDRRTKRLLPFFRVGDRCMYNPARILEALTAVEEGGLTKGSRNSVKRN